MVSNVLSAPTGIDPSCRDAAEDRPEPSPQGIVATDDLDHAKVTAQITALRAVPDRA
jgi:hypothetical protein